MSRLMQFGIGGIGGLLPILASLAAIDISAITTLIDKNELTVGICVGYSIRVLGLFILGGIMAALNSDVKNPMALVQLGIAAPALVTSYMSGALINKHDAHNPLSAIEISSAYADEAHAANIVLAAEFLTDVFKGIQPGLGAEIVTPPSPATQPYRVINMSTKFCLAVSAEQATTLGGYAALVKNFPPPNFTIEPGACSP
ncbi:MAG: hypothetical protein ABR863_04220 [Roseiarcus sp.]|jgi:hypothetical protein